MLTSSKFFVFIAFLWPWPIFRVLCEFESNSFVVLLFLLSHHHIYPLTARVIWTQQMISQPVSSIFPCSPLPSGTWHIPGLCVYSRREWGGANDEDKEYLCLLQEIDEDKYFVFVFGEWWGQMLCVCVFSRRVMRSQWWGQRRRNPRRKVMMMEECSSGVTSLFPEKAATLKLFRGLNWNSFTVIQTTLDFSVTTSWRLNV